MATKDIHFMSFLKGKLGEKRIFIVLISILAALTIYDLTNLTISYISGPKEAKMSINFNESITFPNMTFCLTKNHAWSHFTYNRKLIANESKLEFDSAEYKLKLKEAFHGDRDAFIKAPWQDEKLVMSAYHAIATLNYLEREWDAGRAKHEIRNFGSKPRLESTRKVVRLWLDQIHSLNVSFVDFQQKVGVEVLRRSLMMLARTYSGADDDREDQPSKVRVTWVSLRHLCFQPALPNNTDFEVIADQGKFFKFFLRHNDVNLRAAEGRSDSGGEGNKTAGGNATTITPAQTVKTNLCSKELREDCMTVDFHGRPTTFARSMEGKGRVKDGIGDGLCPGDYVEVSVEIRARYSMLPNEVKPTACKSYEDGNDSEYDCRSRCRMMLIRELCSCTGLTFQYLAEDSDLEKYPLCAYEKCGENATVANVTDSECADKCYPDCQQTRYNVVVDRKGHTASLGSEAIAITQIFVSWNSFEFLKLDQDWKWDKSAFVAALGGSMGMYLGLSVLSLIQLITWIGAKVHAKKIHPSEKYSVSNAPKHSVSQASMEEVNNNPGGNKGGRKISSNPLGKSLSSNPLKSPLKK